MKYLILFIPIFMISNPMMIYDFNLESGFTNWRVVDDVVMGGRSGGNFTISEEGHGLFSGYVSLENNGGFSSVRYRFDNQEVSGYEKVVIRLKGDGKRYQFRVKTNTGDRHSYIAYFETSGDWETIEIALTDLYPTFRGRELNMPNFSGDSMEEIAFLIANNKPEQFRLELDYIQLK